MTELAITRLVLRDQQPTRAIALALALTTWCGACSSEDADKAANAEDAEAEMPEAGADSQGNEGSSEDPNPNNDPVMDSGTEPDEAKLDAGMSDPAPDSGDDEMADAKTEGGVPSNPPADTPVPTEPVELVEYLEGDGYSGFEAETSIHSTTAPHSRRVRTFLNPVLAESLRDKNDVHPIGAASIKEMYNNEDDTVRGWAVMVKVTEEDDAASWFWYERLNDSEILSGTGDSARICEQCHRPGRDYVLTRYPLE